MTETRIKYYVEGYYLNRHTQQREWEMWIRCTSRENALGTYENGLKLLNLKSNEGFNALRVIEVTESIEILNSSIQG